MSEWWTYSLSDFLLFAPRTYYRLFELYNAAIWPTQLAAAALGIAILAALARPRPWHGRAIPLALAGAWLWVALAYHRGHYATINWAADYYAIGFAVEALALTFMALAGGMAIDWKASGGARLGAAMFVFALTLQPLIGPLFGRPWPQVEIFGIAPDPTAIATIGLGLIAAGRRRWLIVPIPIAWCAVSGATLWVMKSPEFAVLTAAIVVALIALWRQRPKPVK